MVGLRGDLLAVMGIVGGALAKSKPIPAAALQALATVLGFVAIERGWLLSGPLLALGAIFAVAGRNESSRHEDGQLRPESAQRKPTTGVWDADAPIRRRRAQKEASVAIPISLWILVGVSLLVAVGGILFTAFGDDLFKDGSAGRKPKAIKRTHQQSRAPRSVEELNVPVLRASAAAPSGVDGCGVPTSYPPTNLMDGDPTTAWRVPGDGIGQVLELRWRHAVHIRRLGLIAGYAKVDPCDDMDRFFENRRVLKVSYAFSDGTSEIQSFDPYKRQVQLTKVGTVTRWIRITILETSGHRGRDYTPISEIKVYGSRA